jgi:cyanophycinase
MPYMNRCIRRTVPAGRSVYWLTVVAAMAALPVAAAELPSPPKTPAVVAPARPLNGTLIICGGGVLPESLLKHFVVEAGGERARIAIISTASEIADDPEVLESRLQFWRGQKLTSLDIVHTRSRDIANDPAFVQPLAQATGVWILGGIQSRLTEVYLGTKAEQAIHDVVRRGGVVGGTSAGAAVMSPVMIEGGNPQPEIGRGFGLLPGAVVDQHFLKRNRQQRLLNALANHPSHFGVGIDEGTALVVKGRRMFVLGDSCVTACLGPCGEIPEKIQRLNPGDEIDLVALSRAAVARVSPRRQNKTELVSETRQGTLVLAGGGAVPADATQRFIEAAGGVDSPLVVVSTAVGDDPPDENEALDWLKQAGAKNVCIIHPRSRHEAESEEMLERLSQARGVWFSGGRTWRLADAFLHSKAETVLVEILKNGGAIGGTAAGASILADYLVRGNPMSNKDIMTDGYDEGFGFIPDAAVDQHFSQRKRFEDMRVLKKARPELLGLGVDEGTALIVQGHTLEVVGENKVAVYDRTQPAASADERDFDTLVPGDKYDLKDRRRLSPPREAETVAASGTSGADEDEEDPTAQPPAASICE